MFDDVIMQCDTKALAALAILSAAAAAAAAIAAAAVSQRRQTPLNRALRSVRIPFHLILSDLV